MRPPHDDQGFQQLLHVRGIRSGKAFGEFLSADGGSGGLEGLLGGAHALGQGFGPGDFGFGDFGFLGGGLFGGGEIEAGLAGGAFRVLVVRAQPADEAPFLLGGALGIEGDEAGEDLLVGGLFRGATTLLWWCG